MGKTTQKTLLLVEDEGLLAMGEAKTLKSFGYRVLTADTGEGAVKAALSDSDIDLILMDIDLGSGIDGTEAARRILEKRALPIVFLTSHGEREMVEKVRGITRYGYVLKNSGEFVLRSSIEMAFELFEAHESLKRKNEELRAVSDRLLGILEHSPLLISEFDLEGRYRLVSRSIGKMFGMEPGDLVGKSFHELLPPEHVRLFLERIKLVMENRGPVTVDDRMAAGEKERVFTTVLFPLFDSRGGVSSVGGIAHDVTDQAALEDALLAKNEDLAAANEELQAVIEEMEAANEELSASSEQLLMHQRDLEASEARYRALFDNNHSVMLLIEPETGSIVDANPSACRWYGWAREEMVGKNISEINTLPPEEVRREMEKARTEERGFFEFHHRRADGETRDVEVYSGPISVRGKALLYSIIHDVTGKKKAEKELSDERERMDHILSSLETGLSLINPDMTIAWVNRKVRDLFPGIDPVGRRCYEFFENRAGPCEPCGTMDTFAAGRSNELERFNKANGRWYQIITQAVKNEQGETIGVLEGIHDITERKKMEESLNDYVEIIDAGPAVAFSWRNEEGWPVDFVSSNCVRILGYSEDDFISGRVSYSSIIHPEDVGRVAEEVASNSKDPGRSSFRHEPYRVTTADGRCRWMDDVTVIRRNKEGAITHYQGVVHDVSPIKSAEEDLRRNEARLRGLVEIFQRQPESVQGFLDYALEQAISLTGSRIGYIYFYDAGTGQFTLNTWSKEVMKECLIQEPRTVYQLEKTGIWGEAVRQRKPVMVNDFQSFHPLKKGYPEGHVELYRFLTVPVFAGGEIVAVVGAGNKETDYDESDILQLTLLMDAVWKVVEQKKSKDEITRLLTEKNLLLREVHHRIKNNMSTIMSLLSLQSASAAEPAVTAALMDARSRIQSMMIVYDKLYRSSDFRNVSMRDYLEPLIDEIISLYRKTAKVTAEKDIEDFPLHSEKLFPVGIVINELLTNALKYAFEDGAEGTIAVKVSRNEGHIQMVVHDNGPGLPRGALSDAAAGFGLRLVKMLVEQLRGKLNIENDGGARFTVTFPL